MQVVKRLGTFQLEYETKSGKIFHNNQGYNSLTLICSQNENNVKYPFST